jgi:hypothetical protein
MKDKSVFQFKIKLEDGRKFNLDLDEDTTIHDDDLNTDLGCQPGLYAWYSQLREDAQHEYDQAKAVLKNLEADLYIECKIRGVPNVPKATDATIKSAILIDDKRLEAEQVMLNKKKQYNKLQAACEALQQRKDLLATLSVNIRSEKNNI